MAQCLIHEDSHWCFNTQVKCIRGEKTTLLPHNYVPKCVHFNYLTLEAGDISAEWKSIFAKHTRQADGCSNERSGFLCESLFLKHVCTFCCWHDQWCFSARAAALCLSACEPTLRTLASGPHESHQEITKTHTEVGTGWVWESLIWLIWLKTIWW